MSQLLEIQEELNKAIEALKPTFVYSDLAVGDKGENVTALKKRLYEYTI